MKYVFIYVLFYYIGVSCAMLHCFQQKRCGEKMFLLLKNTRF